MLWWCGGVVVWWCGGVVVWWCGGVVVAVKRFQQKWSGESNNNNETATTTMNGHLGCSVRGRAMVEEEVEAIQVVEVGC